MTDVQRRRRASYQSILDHFDANAALWSAKRPIAQTVEAWRGLLAKVATQAQIQARDTTGMTRSREEQEAFVIGEAMTLVHRLRAYARVEGDPELLAAVDVTASTLETVSDADLVTTVGRITEAARARPDDVLAEYEVTPPLLDALDGEAATLLPQASSRDASEDATAVATARLKALFPRFVPLRRTLDDLVAGLIDDADFRDGYRQARKVDG